MKFENIKKEPTFEFVAKQIKEGIKNGTIKPGERLPSERDLARMIGVSRTSVREAIHSLTFSGYLKVIQGKGTFVTENSPRYDELFDFFTRINDFTIEHVMEFRVMFEGEFARLAAERATKEDLEVITSHYLGMKNANTIKEHFIKDLGLHAAIASATQNPIIKSFMLIITEKFHKETMELIDMSNRARKTSINSVGKLVEALKNRDPSKAKKYMNEHIMNIENFLKEE